MFKDFHNSLNSWISVFSSQQPLTLSF